MVRKLNIRKYVKFSFASNIIFNNSIFAGCNKKGNKGYSGKGNKSTETNNTKEQHKEETPNNPGKDNKYKEKVDELLGKLNNIEKNNDYLPEKNIAFNKNDLQSEINSIDSEEKVSSIKIKLNNLESELNQKLNELKIDYANRLKEITEGNTKLDLKLDINLHDGDINNLAFNNINDVKTELEALENLYFGQLTSKRDELKAKYNELLKEKDKLADDIKKQVDEVLSNLTEKDFVIKNYTDYKNLYIKIYTIEALSKGNKEGLKKILEDRYESYSTIINNLSLEINDFNSEDLKNKIEAFDKANFLEINKTLDKIHGSITAKILELNTENVEIIKKIQYFNLNKFVEEINNLPTFITIAENTGKAVYDEFVNNIKNLKNSLIDKLPGLRGKYVEKINALNTKLEELGLGSDKINLDGDLNNLTFNNLAENTISSIETAITEAENKCKKFEKYRKDCTNSLEQVKDECDYDYILNNEDIKKLIEEIEKNIEKINDDGKKDAVNESISNLKTQIEEANSVATIKEIINDKNFDIKSENLDGGGFIKLLKDTLGIKDNGEEKNKCTIVKSGTKIKELYHFNRQGRSYFIIFYEIKNFNVIINTKNYNCNRKVVLVTSDRVINIGYYSYNGLTSKTDLFLKCNTTEKPFCETKISYGGFIECINATKNVKCDGLLMKFKTTSSKHSSKDQDADSNGFCFNLINKEVYYVMKKNITKDKYLTLDDFGIIEKRTSNM